MSLWQPNLSWITDQLAVGGSFPPERVDALAREHRVAAVVDLRGEAKPDAVVMRRHGISLLHLPTADMCAVETPDLEYGIRFANEFLDADRRVLIHCEYGIGRSATLALCVLVHRGMPPLEALKLLKRQRPQVSPSPPQFECWRAWLDSYRFARDVDWKLPSFDEFTDVAYVRPRTR